MWKCDKEPSTSKRSHTKAQPRREATDFSTGTASAEKASQLQSSCLAQLLDLIKDFRWWQGGKKKNKGGELTGLGQHSIAMLKTQHQDQRGNSSRSPGAIQPALHTGTPIGTGHEGLCHPDLGCPPHCCGSFLGQGGCSRADNGAAEPLFGGEGPSCLPAALPNCWS